MPGKKRSFEEAFPEHQMEQPATKRQRTESFELIWCDLMRKKRNQIIVNSYCTETKIYVPTELKKLICTYIYCFCGH